MGRVVDRTREYLAAAPPPGPPPDPGMVWIPGANWRRPTGLTDNVRSRRRHPVVQLAYDDAVAYAKWAGKELPREAEWEFAARGGLEGAIFTWGDEWAPGGRMMANTWQGEFPWQNLRTDGFEGTSPVGSFPPNGYGLYDMAGNVWEWTGDEGWGEPEARVTRRVIKGGSHLCAPNYSLRYRPAARQAEPLESSTTHIGFRCVVRSLAGRRGRWGTS